jgi:hypothetical protein
MAPTIASGSAILVSAISPGELRPDDIALFAIQSRLFAHRFRGWRNNPHGHPALEFRGDACSDPDPLVGPDHLIGLVLNIEAPHQIGCQGERLARNVALFAFTRKLMRGSRQLLARTLSHSG